MDMHFQHHSSALNFKVYLQILWGLFTMFWTWVKQCNQVTSLNWGCMTNLHSHKLTIIGRQYSRLTTGSSAMSVFIAVIRHVPLWILSSKCLGAFWLWKQHISVKFSLLAFHSTVMSAGKITVTLRISERTFCTASLLYELDNMTEISNTYFKSKIWSRGIYI